MSERVVGIGLPVTVSGLNVTFAGDDLDSEYYALLTTSHYVYNITRNDTQAITALSGTEAGGYTLAVAAAVGWVTGDYCVPVTTNDKLQYATITLAQAASSAADNFLLTYATSTSAEFSNGAAVALLINYTGLLAHRRVGIYGPITNSGINMSGDLTGQARCKIANLRVYSCGASGILYNDTGAAKSGNGMWCDRIESYGCATYCFRIASGGNGNCLFTRCMAYDAYQGFNTSSGAGTAFTAYNCTVVRTLYGFVTGNKACVLKNCLAAWNPAGDYFQTTSTTATYCADTDGTLPAGTGNRASQTRAQLAFWKHNDNHHYHISGVRILATSVLAGAGDYQAGQPTTDIDGADITTSCPIGCHKGTANAFGVSWPSAAETDPLAAAFQTFAAAVTPAMDVPTLANIRTTDTLRGAPGTCTVPAAGDLKSGVQCGAGGTEVTGTRTDCAAANARFGSGTFGDPGAPITPTCKVPAKADVRLGVAVDVSDTGLINVPTAAQTLVGTPVDQTTGTLQPRVLISESIEEV